MDIFEANNRIVEIEKEINILLDKKEVELSKVLPQAQQMKKDIVTTSRTENNKFLHYVYSVEEYDQKIDILEKIKMALIDYVNKELVRLKKYNQKEQLIVYYRENKSKKYKWESISRLVGLSQTHCRRIYREYKNKRNGKKMKKYHLWTAFLCYYGIVGKKFLQ